MSIDAAALTGRGNYYEDFVVGDVYEHARGKTMEALENVLLTNLVLNTAQLHFNEDLAEKVAAQKHRIVFGGVTASLVIGLAMQDTGEQALEEVGLDKVRFRVSVIHGDTLYAFTEVVAKDDSAAASRGHKDAGLVQDVAAGTRRIYRLNPVALAALRDQLDTYWQRALAGYADAVEEPAEEA